MTNPLVINFLKEFPAHWTLAGHGRACPKCNAAVGKLCVASDGVTLAAGGLCHAERVQAGET